MRYSLIFEIAATEAIATMPEVPHGLFMLACFDIVRDPYGQGGLREKKVPEGVKRTWAVGAMGFIVYEVDEETSLVTIASVMSML